MYLGALAKKLVIIFMLISFGLMKSNTIIQTLFIYTNLLPFFGNAKRKMINS